jgi:hypothetical protein
MDPDITFDKIVPNDRPKASAMNHLYFKNYSSIDDLSGELNLFFPAIFVKQLKLLKLGVISSCHPRLLVIQRKLIM